MGMRRKANVQGLTCPRIDLSILDLAPTLGICNGVKISCKVIITQVNHGTRPETRIQHELMGDISKVKFFQMSRIRWHSSAAKHPYLDAQKVSSRPKATGIIPDTLILVWHFSAYNLTLLRFLLDSWDYSGILPQLHPYDPTFQIQSQGVDCTSTEVAVLSQINYTILLVFSYSRSCWPQLSSARRLSADYASCTRI